MKNPWRRWEGLKRARRVLRVWRNYHSDANEGWYDHGSLQEQRLLRTRAACSCPMCGNPRRWFGEVTLQEKKADVVMAEQLQEVGD